MLAHLDLLAALQDAHPAAEWLWLTSVPTGALARPALVVWPVALERGPRRHSVVTTVECWLLSPRTDEAAADAELADHLVTLLGLFDSLPLLAWDRIDRGVLNDRYHGWRALVTLAHTLDHR